MKVKKAYCCIGLLMLTITIWADFKDIKGNTYLTLRDTFRNEYKRAQKNLSKANKLNKGNDDTRITENAEKWKTYINKLENSIFICPEHSICTNCISKDETCKACSGKRFWGGWGWQCKLCESTGHLYKPAKTYCPNCKGIWDKGINCKNCNKTGLINCKEHTICSKCKTFNGKIIGKSLK